MSAKLLNRARPPRRRQPRRQRDTRRQILDASLHLFSEHGFARTTVRDIAHDVGITNAALYYHFASKQDLLEALFEEKGIVPAIQGLQQTATQRAPRDALLVIARQAMSLMQASRDFARLVLMEALGSEPGAVAEYSSLMERWEEGVSRLLTIYIRRGQLQEMDADITARQIVTLLLAAFFDDLLGRFGPSPDKSGELSPALESYLTVSLDNILSGILPPPTPTAPGR